MGALGLSVLPEFRGQGLGLEILNARHVLILLGFETFSKKWMLFLFFIHPFILLVGLSICSLVCSSIYSFICPFVRLPNRLIVPPSIFIHLSTFLPTRLSVYSSIRSSVCLSVRLLVGPFVCCLFARSPTSSFICPSICLCAPYVSLSVHPPYPPVFFLSEELQSVDGLKMEVFFLFAWVPYAEGRIFSCLLAW